MVIARLGWSDVQPLRRTARGAPLGTRSSAVSPRRRKSPSLLKRRCFWAREDCSLSPDGWCSDRTRDRVRRMLRSTCSGAARRGMTLPSTGTAASVAPPARQRVRKRREAPRRSENLEATDRARPGRCNSACADAVAARPVSRGGRTLGISSHSTSWGASLRRKQRVLFRRTGTPRRCRQGIPPASTIPVDVPPPRLSIANRRRILLSIRSVRPGKRRLKPPSHDGRWSGASGNPLGMRAPNSNATQRRRRRRWRPRAAPAGAPKRRRRGRGGPARMASASRSQGTHPFSTRACHSTRAAATRAAKVVTTASPRTRASRD